MKFCVFWRTRMAAAKLSCYNLEFNAEITYLTWVNSERDRCSEQIYTAKKLEGKNIKLIFTGRRLWRRHRHCLSSLISADRERGSLSKTTSKRISSRVMTTWGINSYPSFALDCGDRGVWWEKGWGNPYLKVLHASRYVKVNNTFAFSLLCCLLGVLIKWMHTKLLTWA